MKVSGQPHAPAALFPTPFYMRLVGPQSQSRRCGEGISLIPQSEFEPRNVQPVA